MHDGLILMANCLEELTNYIARNSVHGFWGWGPRNDAMLGVAHWLNEMVVGIKTNVKERGGYMLFRPEGAAELPLGGRGRNPWDRRRRDRNVGWM